MRGGDWQSGIAGNRQANKKTWRWTRRTALAGWMLTTGARWCDQEGAGEQGPYRDDHSIGRTSVIVHEIKWDLPSSDISMSSPRSNSVSPVPLESTPFWLSIANFCAFSTMLAKEPARRLLIDFKYSRHTTPQLASLKA
jgi:hypothetical protein